MSASPSVVAFVVAAAMAAALVYPSAPPSRAPSLARLLRALVVGLLAAALFDLAWVSDARTIRRARIAFVVDASGSMGRADPHIESSRRGRLLEALEAVPRGSDSDSTGRRLAEGRLSTLSRIHRVRRLLESIDGVVTSRFDSKLFAFGETLEAVNEIPTADRPATDLDAALRGIAGLSEEERPRAVVVLSDGRHNGVGDPESASTLLASRGVVVHAVGVGSSWEPIDVSVLDVSLPSPVFLEDRARGSARLAVRVESPVVLELSIRDPAATGEDGEVDPDDGPAGIVWRSELAAQPSAMPREVEVPFELPAGSLESGRRELVLRVEPLPTEITSTNNERRLLADVRERELRVLLVDGRPRWETRFLENIFERDARFGANVVVARIDDEGSSLSRGDGGLPATRDGMREYGVFLIGDVSRSTLGDDACEWIRERVADGAALVFLAGTRGHIDSLRDGPLGPLIPVARMPDDDAREAGALSLRLRPTVAGQSVEALEFVEDATINAEIWSLLRPPRWVYPALELPGSEVWLTAAAGTGDAADESERRPVIVARRFGLGSTLFVGIEDTWRWRHRVGDEYHARFWTQVIENLRPASFAVGDHRFAIDTDRAMYPPGARAELRARVSNEDGSAPAPDPLGVTATIVADGARAVATVPLERSPSDGHRFEAVSTPLAPGRYRVDVVAGERRLSLPIWVAEKRDEESRQTSWDEELPRRVAELTGGRYLREERIGELLPLLDPLTESRVVESRFEVTRSPWYFGLVVVLLTFEWVLRKRRGLV